MESELIKQTYGANDIVSLSAGKAFRQKIGMYLTADRQEAINLGLRELIVNVQDEYEVYKPVNPFLKITLNSTTHEITVQDNMRGIPVGVREDGINSLTAAFLIPHSGGKHQEGAYTSSIGINGEGNKIVCHTAKWLEVEVYRDGKIYRQSFASDEEGAKPTTDVREELQNGSNNTGTIITYEPDCLVYGDCFIDFEKLRSMLRELSYFTKGLKINLIVDGKEEIFFSKNGLIDGLDNSNSIGKPFSYFYETPDCKVELALQWVSKKGTIKGYANGLYMPDGGAFIVGFKTALTRTFNSLSKNNFGGDAIRELLNGFVSVKVRVGQFSNQAKTALANVEARTATSAAISEALKDFSLKHKSDFEKVIELLNKIAKADAAAERARQKILNNEKEQVANQKNKFLNIDKLRDARKLGSDSILLLCEGLSAGGSMSIGRNPDKYGILMLRGKCKNLLNCPIEEGLENEEVKLFQQSLGIIYGKPFVQKNLRYGSVAIASDSDFDGSHIGLLILAMAAVLCPQLLKENKFYWLRAPIYKVATKKKNYYYYTEGEFLNHPNGEITRYKGLGQMDDEDLKNSMFNDEWQKLEPINFSDEGLELLTKLMGNDVDYRKEFVYNNIDFSKFIIE